MALLAHPAPGPLTLRREPFGPAPDGTPVYRWTFGDPAGVTAAVLTYGAILQSCRVPDRDGVPGDVVLGLPEVADYAADETYLGALVGRYANRIAGARFVLDGTEYRLPANDRGNTLHGGPDGFHRRVWTSAGIVGADRVGVRLRLHSPDGDMGFPGALDIEVAYTVDRSGTLAVDYQARTDRPTVVNPTQHAYWNLSGSGNRSADGGNGDNGDIGAHLLDVAADTYLPVDAHGIPYGPEVPLHGTPLARHGQPLRDVLDPDVRARHPQLAAAGGLDHCFVLRRSGGEEPSAPRLAARLADPRSGRILRVATTEPGLQVYTANGPTPPFGSHSAVCLETQHFPDAPNRPTYPPTVLRPGELHRSTTHYRFTHLPIGSRAYDGSSLGMPPAPD
ncbi:aldose epimerase family protein [Yinghuangia soli]|uniref:Aldose 1-epimerase n=1 Tax=Yinghuangia soli TaxID=2908204 RepID=A0AA41Q0D1_9ACTN|nr:galactose mutarotase [Yinghuangia soli]